MYKIVLPILGFEDCKSLSVEKIDDFFSFLVFDGKTKPGMISNFLGAIVGFFF